MNLTRHLSVGLALLTASCAASHGTARELPAAARAYLVSAPAVYAAPDAGAPASPETARLRAAYEGGLPPEVRSLVRHDAALDLAASMILTTYADDDATPSTPLAIWLFWKSGTTALYSHVRPSWAAKRDAQGRLDMFATQHAKAYKPPFPIAYGAARAREGQFMPQVEVLGWASIDVATFQKTYAPGAPLTLQVRPRDASTDFVLFMDTEDGVTEERMTPRDDGSFFISRAVPTVPGRYFIEIRAREPKGMAPDSIHPWMRTLLWVPIYVGMPEPSEPDDAVRHPLLAPEQPSAWPAWMVQQINLEPARHKKTLLDVDPRVTALAQERAVVLASADGELPPDQDLTRKLSALGLAVRSQDEKQGTFDSVADHLYLRTLQPSVRKRLLFSNRMTLGIGIAPRPPDAKGRVRYREVEYAVTTNDGG